MSKHLAGNQMQQNDYRDTNPYSPSAVDPFKGNDQVGSDEREAFREIATTQLRKHYADWRSTNVFAMFLSFFVILFILGFAINTVSLLMTPPENIKIELVDLIGMSALFCIFLFMLFTVIGTFLRTNTGRWLGIGFSVLMIIYLPFAVIGIYGIIGYIRGKAMFGPDRLNYQQVKQEYQRRKKLQIP